MFASLYDKALTWAKHRHAEYYLALLSFTESSFFPIPPDVMLAPMTLAQRDKAVRFALITTIASVLGGVLGYLIGQFGFELAAPLIERFGYTEKFEMVNQWFNEWGFWVVFLAGFSPIPYKLFTISAGVASMAFFPFLIASAVGRGARFFLVALLIAKGGEKMEHAIRKHIDALGWGVVILVLIFVLIKFS